jgi:hypothetical protein
LQLSLSSLQSRTRHDCALLLFASPLPWLLAALATRPMLTCTTTSDESQVEKEAHASLEEEASSRSRTQQVNAEAQLVIPRLTHVIRASTSAAINVVSSISAAFCHTLHTLSPLRLFSYLLSCLTHLLLSCLAPSFLLVPVSTRAVSFSLAHRRLST